MAPWLLLRHHIKQAVQMSAEDAVLSKFFGTLCLNPLTEATPGWVSCSLSCNASHPNQSSECNALQLHRPRTPISFPWKPWYEEEEEQKKLPVSCSRVRQHTSGTCTLLKIRRDIPSLGLFVHRLRELWRTARVTVHSYSTGKVQNFINVHPHHFMMWMNFKPIYHLRCEISPGSSSSSITSAVIRSSEQELKTLKAQGNKILNFSVSC